MEEEDFKVTIALLREGEGECLSDKKLADALESLNYLESQTALNEGCYTGDAIKASEPIRALLHALSEDAYLYNVHIRQKP